MRMLAAIFFGIILSSNMARAVEQELLIPLPDLIGFYEMTRFEPSHKSSAILIPDDVSHIITAGLRMTGAASLGTIYCPNDDVFEDATIEMSTRLDDEINGIIWLNSILFWENGTATKQFSAFVPFGAVQVLCYEVRMAALADSEKPKDQLLGGDWDVPPARVEELELYYAHLEQTLVDLGFHDRDNPRQTMQRLRRLFGRIRLDAMELSIMRGVLTGIQNAAHRLSVLTKKEESAGGDSSAESKST